jgi:hypothetical protein
LAVLFSDPKKEAIRNFKSRILEKMGLTKNDHSDLDRASIREALTAVNKGLISQAKKSGIKNYSSFIDAGYHGLYGMSKRELTDKRNQEREANIHNCMNKTELFKIYN